MTLNTQQTIIMSSILITSIMLFFFSYILKGYNKLKNYLYKKAVTKYPEPILGNKFGLKLLNSAILLYLYLLYITLIYFIVTLVVPYNT